MHEDVGMAMQKPFKQGVNGVCVLRVVCLLVCMYVRTYYTYVCMYVCMYVTHQEVLCLSSFASVTSGSLSRLNYLPCVNSESLRLFNFHQPANKLDHIPLPSLTHNTVTILNKTDDYTHVPWQYKTPHDIKYQTKKLRPNLCMHSRGGTTDRQIDKKVAK